MRVRVAVFAVALCMRAGAQVLVDESAIHAHLVNGKTVVTLAIESRENQAKNAIAELEWLGPSDQQNGLVKAAVTIQRGKSSVDVPMPLSSKIADPLLERLRYQLIPDRTNFTAFEAISGIVSFVHIADYAFSLRVIAPGILQPDKPYELRALTFHPVTDRPIPGVSVRYGTSIATSDEHGIATLHVTSTTGQEGAISIVDARIGDLSLRQDVPDIRLAQSQLKIQCDKPIYQPGQTVHIRLLALAADGKAEAGAEHSLKIFDEHENIEYTAALTTSRFGIAATDWNIPSNANSGDYRIEVELEDSDDDSPAVHTVSIRHYELPSFRVGIQLDRPYYLPHQSAAIEVRGDYLFGKPVAAGKVRISEGDDDNLISQGTLDAKGQFRTTLDTGQPDFGPARFIDRHFTAFVTDTSTNRTEQRQFDLRVSRDPLHLYIAKQEVTPTGQRLYVTTYSPDGAPLRADVSVSEAGRVLAEGKTSRFGLVRLDLPSRTGKFLVRAVVGDGRRAELPVDSLPSSNTLWLETDRTLYRTGEQIHCTISAEKRSATALLVAWNSHGQTLLSRDVRLTNGKAALDIPYQSTFGKELAMAVISGNSVPAMSRMVLFPNGDGLDVRATALKAEYRPGDTARLEFHTSSQAALGIAIIDQSVLERASTDAAFGPRRWFGSDADEQKRIGNVTYSDLLNLDPSRIDDDLQSVAGVLVERPPLADSFDSWFATRQNAYMDIARRSVQSLGEALDSEYLQGLNYPRDERSYFQIAERVAGAILDPWMKPYFPRFSIEGRDHVLRVCSAGPDKRIGTDDDFCALEVQRSWFAPFESVMRDALFHLEDYPATNDEFIALLDSHGIRFDRLTDPWQTPLRTSVGYVGDRRVIEIKSAGPDRQWGTEDDFDAAEFRGSYFSRTGKQIDAAVDAAKQFPRTASAFYSLLSTAGLNFQELRDPWGHRYYVDFHFDESYYDRPRIYTYEQYLGLQESRKELVPSKHTFLVLDVKSSGPDGLPNTYDDVTVMSCSHIVEDNEAKQENLAQAPPTRSPAGTGTIAGTVRDASGAAVANVSVTLNDTYSTRSNSLGSYIFSGMPGGYFRLQFQAPGFQVGVLDHVPVEADHVTNADYVLQVGAVSQTVEVEAAPNKIATSTAELASVAGPSSATIATPRVREYFPETLYWNPELITNTSGNAAVNVKLADTITNWHVAVFASSQDGRVTETSTDVRAFQPFQVDLDLPSVLTQGDQISLSVPIRNYLPQIQNVKVSAAPRGGLILEQPPRQPDPVAASSSANVTLSLRGAAAGEDTHLRVSATGLGVSDAIDKPMRIHPDGERIERSVNGVVGNEQLLTLYVPATALPGSIKAEVKIYPTLIARLLDAMQALLQRPYGCAEQSISSAYPNLLFLKAVRGGGIHDVPLEQRAKRNLEAGYARLLGYQSDDGGFRYWASAEPDAALTAYALQFLTDAKEFIEVADDRITQAQSWLKRQTLAKDSVGTLTLWGLVTTAGHADPDIDRRLGELARSAAEFEDPYAIAAFALAAMDAGHADLAESSVRRLCALATNEQGMAYWAFRTNTPFHGWGRAGQVETTALVLSALAKWRKLGRGGSELQQVIDRGALFLLRNTDASGAWSTSQSTVRALLALLEIPAASPPNAPANVDILFNGSGGGRIALSERSKISGPATLDLSSLVRPGAANNLLIRTDGSEPIQLQLTITWYEPWTKSHSVKDFAMKTEFSTTRAAVNQAVTCRVKITRGAFRGYGMMIAEVGLPPGVETDRGTLESILDDAKSGVDSFEVAPDHITFYVWPRASDSNFQFVFRPRFPMQARMAQSALYDYYNPDEAVVIVPAEFSVNE